MTASISHEIRQPMAAIVANANAGLRWLKRPDPNLVEVQAALERIVRDAHRLDDVIASIRAMFGKEARELSLIDIRTLVGEVLALAQDELETHRILLHDEMRDGLPEVMAQRVQLQQVLLNLIINAIEAMSAVAGRERRLTITSGLDERAHVRSQWRIREAGSIRLTSNASLIRSLRQNPTEWAWAFPSAGQSSKRMAAGCGHRHEVLSGRPSMSRCRARRK